VHFFMHAATQGPSHFAALKKRRHVLGLRAFMVDSSALPRLDTDSVPTPDNCIHVSLGCSSTADAGE